MEQLKFQDTESGETFEGFGRCLAESRIYGRNYAGAKAKFYQIENRQRLATIPDFLIVAVLGPDQMMVEKFNDHFHLASWMKVMVAENIKDPGEDMLYPAMQKIMMDASANDLDLRKVHSKIIEYRQILQGKRKPKADPKPEAPAVPPVIKKPVDPVPFPWF